MGTIVELKDGRRGTAVYNGLDGVGIKWGEYNITENDIKGDGGMTKQEIPEDYEWKPDAMLREDYPSADLPCVGEDYEIINLPQR